MKCPKCQTEIKSNAKFCTKCGCNLAVEMAKMQATAPQQPVKTQTVQMKPTCAKCGSPLMPGARFCTKCGTPVAATPAPAAPQAPVTSAPAQAVAKTSVTPATAAPVQPPVTSTPASQTPVTAVPVQPPVAPTLTPQIPVTPAKTQIPAQTSTQEQKAPVQPPTQPQSPIQTTPKTVVPTPQAPVSAPNPAPVQEEKTLYIFPDENKTAGSINPGQIQVPPQPPVPPTGNNAGIVPPENPKKGKKPKKNNAPTAKSKDDEKASPALIIVVVVLAVLVIASGIICFLVWNGTISLPFGNTATEKTIDEEESTEATTEAETSTVDADELFAETDTLAETGKGQIAVDAEIVDGMNNLNVAIQEYASKAEEAGDISLAVDRINDAYVSYITAIVRHKDMLSASTLSGAIYKQILIEIDDAIALGDDLAAKGYEVDYSSLTSVRDEFTKSYTDRVVSTFDEFTTRPQWSRTESWNLMSETADNMFNTSDLDNPLRLRYAYALSWWIQKQIETELQSGTITAKGAAIKIGGMIETMDYNPMMINYYINYMNDAGEDCTDVSQAYDDIVNQLSQTQGITLGQDISLDHFWYFNDFGEYSGDVADGATNGVTPENRQWIRDRMANVEFVAQ